MNGRLLLASALALVLALSGGCATAGTARPSVNATPVRTLRAGSRPGALFADGRVRTWTLYVPPGLDPEVRVPLVVILHGSGGSGSQCLADNGWIQEADRRGFIVAAPDGAPVLPDEPPDTAANPRLWNEGRLRGAGPRSAIDDVAFITAMLDALQTDLPIDRNRVFAAGVSNGGSMTFRLAAEASDRLAAVVAVASVPWIDERPIRPMPTLVVIGTDDPLVPLGGGIVRSPWFKEVRPPVRPMLRFWAGALGMDRPLVTTVLDDTNVLVEEWSPRAESSSPATYAPAPMTVVYVKGFGHGWPGGVRAGLPSGATGPMPQTFDATGRAWEFFSRAPSR